MSAASNIIIKFSYWYVLHSVAYNYPENPNDVTKKKSEKNWFSSTMKKKFSLDFVEFSRRELYDMCLVYKCTCVVLRTVERTLDPRSGMYPFKFYN